MTSQARSAQPAVLPRLAQALIQAFQQPDIRKRLMFTFFILVVFRFVAHVPIPGVDTQALTDAFEGNAVLSYLNLFSGGALRKLSVAAMGVYPYITATIVMQLLIPIVPSLQALSKEGEQGRNKITLTPTGCRSATVWVHPATHPAAASAVSNIASPAATLCRRLRPSSQPTAGVFLIWLGGYIANGIGGISLIIFRWHRRWRARCCPASPAPIGACGISILACSSSRLIASSSSSTRGGAFPLCARSTFRGGRMYRQSGRPIPLRVNPRKSAHLRLPGHVPGANRAGSQRLNDGLGPTCRSSSPAP
jgi:preprotein translocase subunit SecY